MDMDMSKEQLTQMLGRMLRRRANISTSTIGGASVVETEDKSGLLVVHPDGKTFEVIVREVGQ